MLVPLPKDPILVNRFNPKLLFKHASIDALCDFVAAVSAAEVLSLL